jgi:hypothetical protein
MLKLAKKTALVGTGIALASSDKIQGVMGKSQHTWDNIEDKTEKILTDFSAFWFYANWMDEIEDRVEKVICLILKELHIPERRELEEIRARIERLEKEAEDQ